MKHLVPVFLCFLLLFSVFTEGQSETNKLEGEAELALIEAEVVLQEMRQQGMGTAYADDLLLQARQAFEGEDLELALTRAKYLNQTGQEEEARALLQQVVDAQRTGSKLNPDYKTALLKVRQIQERKKEAYALRDQLQEVNLTLNELEGSPFDLSESHRSFQLAEESFKLERFPETRTYLNQTLQNIHAAKAEYSVLNALLKASRNNVESFVKENGYALLAAFFALSVLGYLSYRVLRKRRLEERVRFLKKEVAVLQELLKRIQEDFYLNHAISRQVYELRKEQYQRKLLKIKSELPVMEKQLKRFL